MEYRLKVTPRAELPNPGYTHHEVNPHSPTEGTDPLFYLPQGAALKDLFKAVMTASEEVVTSKIQNLVTRLTGARETNTEIDRLAIRLERQYPGDVGVLCAYLLNYVRVGACPNPATV